MIKLIIARDSLWHRLVNWRCHRFTLDELRVWAMAQPLPPPAMVPFATPDRLFEAVAYEILADGRDHSRSAKKLALVAVERIMGKLCRVLGITKEELLSRLRD